jgi:hypothetical protein
MPDEDPNDEVSRCVWTTLRPVVTAFLGTDSADPRAAASATRRWRNLRRSLERDGADEPTLAAMDEAVGVDSEVVRGGISPAEDNVTRPEPDAAAEHGGGDVVAIVAAEGRVLLRRDLPEIADVGRGRVSALAWVTPLLRAQQGMIPHVVVLADRRGADVWAVDQRGHVEDSEVRGETHQLTLVNQGGLSHQRIHQRAVNTWDANAREVAEEVSDLVRGRRPKAVFVAGDPSAVGFFAAALPGDVAPLVRRLTSGARGPESGWNGVAAEVRRSVRTIAAEETTALLAQFEERRGRGTGCVEGAHAVVESLQMAVVETLLVADDEADEEREAWFGPDAPHIALDRAELAGMGVPEPEHAPLVDVAVRSAIGTGARLHVVPRHAVGGGLGAILRT